MNTGSRSVAAILVGGLALATAALSASAQDVDIPEGATPVVGMAYDPSTEELWLAGPRADRGVFVEAAGVKEARLNADIVSVQALSWHGDRLWVGDIGDEDAERDHIVVYRLSDTETAQGTYHAYDYRYEDGPRDAKAMLISGRGNVYIVTSGEDPGIYRIRGEASRSAMNTLVRVHDAPEGVTDAVFLNDGSTMALRTAEGIQYVDAMAWEDLVLETIVGAPEGESIAVGLDDELFVGGNPGVRSAVVVSESTTTTFAPEPEPTGSPEATESPGATESPTATADATEAPAEEAVEAEGPARAGTITALVLAGIVAVAAGLVTYFWRN